MPPVNQSQRGSTKVNNSSQRQQESAMNQENYKSHRRSTEVEEINWSQLESTGGNGSQWESMGVNASQEVTCSSSMRRDVEFILCGEKISCIFLYSFCSLLIFSFLFLFTFFSLSFLFFFFLSFLLFDAKRYD